jgi:hypothetical protein
MLSKEDERAARWVAINEIAASMRDEPERWKWSHSFLSRCWLERDDGSISVYYNTGCFRAHDIKVVTTVGSFAVRGRGVGVLNRAMKERDRRLGHKAMELAIGILQRRAHNPIEAAAD